MVHQTPQTNGQALNDIEYSENAGIAKPIALIINPSEDSSACAGEIFELRVTVTNQGNKGAVINIYIDETSGLLRQWCSSASESLALANNCSAEVVFYFAIPINATPENHSYLLVIDAPKHYPEDTPIRHQARLQILPSVQSATQVNDPTFQILPITTYQKPTIIEPGKPLDCKIIVNNRSSRVDRFRLSCSDLPNDWFTVIYPEGLVELGLVGERQSLALNPGAKSEIIFRLQFPLNVKAGNYSPTLRLTSLNNLDLVLIDVLYLRVLPTYRLIPELQTKIGKVSKETGWFRLLLGNGGNTLRNVSFSAEEDAGKPICTYTFDPEQVKLGAQLKTQIDLKVKPNKWWRRPWFGKGLPIEFYIEIEDSYQLPVPERLPGTLIWEARPLWQFILLIFMILGAIASLIFAIWWVFFRPPTPPKILEFTSVFPTYEQAAGDAIHLNWQILQPQQLKTIKIIGIAADSGIVSSEDILYDFSKGIPPELKEFCTLESVLNCQNIRTDAQQAGTYIFQMDIFAKKGYQLADSKKTNTIRISALPQPKILDFMATQTAYQEPAPNQSVLTFNNEIALNWKIKNPEQLQALKLMARSTDDTVIIPLKTYDFSDGIPSELSGFCLLESELICQRVPTNARKAGNYIFELSAVSKETPEETAISQKSDIIKIIPYIYPTKIVSFLVNDQDALPKYILPINPEKTAKTIRISWKVEGGKNTIVELLPAPGTVGLEGSIIYPITQQPGIETITLAVKGESGEQLNRTVTFEKIVVPISEPKIPPVDKQQDTSLKDSRTPKLTPNNPNLSPNRPNQTVPKLSTTPPNFPLLPTAPTPIPTPTPSPTSSPTPTPTPSFSASPIEIPPQFD